MRKLLSVLGDLRGDDLSPKNIEFESLDEDLSLLLLASEGSSVNQ